jgi:NADH-quinone oxidoreductase subunit I
MFDLITKGFDSIVQAFYGLYQVGRGLKTVGEHTFRDPTTQSYPDVMPKIAPHFRGRLALTVHPETGEHLCISCRQCERVCPDKCIDITAHKSPETNKLELIDFKIDHGLCMFCGLCTEVCPTSCIINTNDFEMADYSREALIYDLKKLTLSQEESAFYFEAQELTLPKPKPAKPAAPAAKPEAAEKVASVAVATASENKPVSVAKSEAKVGEINKEAGQSAAPKQIVTAQQPEVGPKSEDNAAIASDTIAAQLPVSAKEQDAGKPKTSEEPLEKPLSEISEAVAPAAASGAVKKADKNPFAELKAEGKPEAKEKKTKDATKDGPKDSKPRSDK